MSLDTNIMEGYFDTEYFVSGFRNQRPLWRGLGKSQIFFSPSTSTWRLESLYDSTKVRIVLDTKSNVACLRWSGGKGRK